MNNITIPERYYIHSILSSLVVFIFYLLTIPTSFFNASILNYNSILAEPFDWTIYPLEYVPNPFSLTYEERQKKYEDIDSKFFIKTPIYDPNILSKDPSSLNKNSQEYKDIVTKRLIYTIVYMWNYEYDYKEYAWSHPWVDIISPLWTPVKNIANWVVVAVGFQSGWYWNYVVVRHDWAPLWDGKKWKIFSVYAHMNSSLVKEWTKILKWDQIWTVWNTWTATTSHLHFQIELDKWQITPYWPFSWSEAKAKELWFFGWINAWLWKEKAIAVTLNPLVFINNNLNFVKEVPKVEEINNSNHQVPPPVIPNNEVPVVPIEQPEQPEQNNNVSSNINLDWTIKREEVIKQDLVVFANQDQALFEQLKWNLNQTTILNWNSWSENLSNTNSWFQNSTWWLFKDIPNNYKNIEQIKYFVEKKNINGYKDWTFRPTNNVTRAESLKIIFWALNLWLSNNTWTIFTDVNIQSWENTYINTALDLQVINKETTQFYPWRNVSRAEALKIILNLAKVDLTQASNTKINDVIDTDWSAPYVKYWVDNGLIFLNNWNFNPNKPLTREELLLILYRYLNKK